MKGLTHNEFVAKLNKITPELEVIGEFLNTRSKVLVQDSEGIIYNASAAGLLRGMVPSIFTAEDKNSAFKVSARKVHQDSYNYSKINYIHNKEKVIITCPIHGDFLQMPNDHLSESGCTKCGNKNESWTYESWREAGIVSKNFTGFKFYILKIWNEEELFYKVGKTFRTIALRYGPGNTTTLPYNYEVVKTLEGSALFIHNLEKEFIEINKSNGYTPRIEFGGKSECFTMINIGEI